MNIPFEPVVLAGMRLRNRVIRSATHEGMADEHGAPTDRLKDLYLRLGKGSAGAIITGYAGIRQDGKCPLYRMLMIDDDRLIPAYKSVTKAVHETETPIILQIAHSGRQTRSRVTDRATVGPSAIRNRFYSEDVPRELRDEEIEGIVDGFVAAIGRAREAGFDGVQLHVAHGYLLSDFLSPYANRRTDRWGGSTENRFRIISEIFRRARPLVGSYPLLVKLNAYDGRKGGMRIEEAVPIARLLERSGCDAIEVSCGTSEDGFLMSRGGKVPMEAVLRCNFKYKSLPKVVKALMKPLGNVLSRPVRPLDNYNVPAALSIKSAVAIPVIAVGGIASLADIADIVGAKGIDFVSMCRPFVAEPGIVKRFQEGKAGRSRCIRCNYCIILAEELPLSCYYGKLKA